MSYTLIRHRAKYIMVMEIIIALTFWFLFTIWNRRNSTNLLFKVYFLVLAIYTTIETMYRLGYIIRH